MSLPLRFSSIVLAAAALVAPSLVPCARAENLSETIIHSFAFNGVDGNGPNGGLIMDQAGNLYGVTAGGGSGNWGTVFELSPPSPPGGQWTETILFSLIEGQSFGLQPNGPLVLDQAGNLWGTTYYPSGTVFKLSPPSPPGGAWTPTLIYTFDLNTGVNLPEAGIVFDQAGNIYGTASMGGGFCRDYNGCGGVYQLLRPKTPGGAWTERVIFSFPGIDTLLEAGPGGYGTLVFDESGALYGTTVGPGPRHFGTVYKLTPPTIGHTWNHTVLYRFQGGSDGINPFAGVTLDAQGNIYGTTRFGGGAASCGTVFQLTPLAGGTWTENVLYRFQGGADGCSPESNVILDAYGNIYGTTAGGGDPSCYGGDCGTVFQLSPPLLSGGSWTKTTLHAFAQGSGDGQIPTSGVIFGGNGSFYGETAIGGSTDCYITGCGVVYSVTP